MIKQRDTSKRVAIVVPLSNNPELTSDEEVSINHLVHFLGDYDKYIVIPEALSLELPGFSVKRFSGKYFGSVMAHTRLMLSAEFYQAFTDYEYILIYHPDALVFSDKLKEWCDADLDYIAAPWVNFSGKINPAGFSRCGNGGFSLRKVESFLRVINPAEQLVSADSAWDMLIAARPRYHRYLLRPLKYFMRMKGINRSWWVRRLYRRNEDRFWSDQARSFYPDFRICTAEEGLRFAFDHEPQYCFEKNNKQLPFGCHGWNKYDRNFWEPLLVGVDKD